MSAASITRLLLLSAIWGASFLFMRIGAPILGPVLLIFTRVGLAALFLLLVGSMLRKALETRQHWRHYFVLGLFNSALPFFLFAFAAQTVSASLLSVLNATAPIWAACIGAFCFRSRLTPKALFGMALGVVGVGLLAGIETLALPGKSLWAVAAGLGAAFCYGIATTYTRSAPPVAPFANAHGSMWAATLLLAPFTLQAPLPPAAASLQLVLAVLALGIVCSGFAYLLYFRLIADLGAAGALSVTFLIPLFGILWGSLFLGEKIGWHTIIGGLAVLAGTALVTGFSPAALIRKKLGHA